MTNMIRKSLTAIKGGPGGVGVWFDKVAKLIKTNDGSTVDRVVDTYVAGLNAITAATYTVSLPADNGKRFSLTRLAGITVTLPAVSSANKGQRVTFINALLPTSNNYNIAPASTDRIGYLADNTALTNTAATDVLSDAITLESDGVDGWIIVDRIGIWA